MLNALRLTVSAVSVIVVAACAGPAANELSEAEHTAAAAAEEAKSDQHRAKYDPEAVASRPLGGHPQAGHFFPIETYNPTDRQLQSAARHEKVALAHEKAATLLSTFDEGVCGELPSLTRAMCPLLAQVKSVRDIERGVFLRPDDGVPLEPWAVHIQCDIAFARSARALGTDECPLFADGVSATVVNGGVELVLEEARATPAALALLRTAARTHI